MAAAFVALVINSEAHAACAAVASPEHQVARSQVQPDLLHAKPTDQGLVLRLDDVLFTSGRADLTSRAMGSLNQLVTFLAKYPDRSVTIRGHADSVGSEAYNQGLSDRRANSVKAYLAAQGIGLTRLFASGMGQKKPVGGNDSGAGRQQNRRVEVIVSNPPATATHRDRTAQMLVLLGLLESIGGASGLPLR